MDVQFDIDDAVDPSGHLMQVPLAKHDGMHCEADVEPVLVVVVPSLHAVHEVALYLSLKKPLLHTEQLMVLPLDSDIVPGEHTVHTCCPTSLVNDPASHRILSTLPEDWK